MNITHTNIKQEAAKLGVCVSYSISWGEYRIVPMELRLSNEMAFYTDSIDMAWTKVQEMSPFIKKEMVND